ncbi:MAG: hypothetical protein ACE5EV_04760 [Gaiellales bacterium]
MGVLALALAAALAIVTVLLVAWPLVRARRADEPEFRDPTPAELDMLRLLEERDRVLAALQELEFDRRSEKIAEDDYEFLRASLRRDAANVLERLDRLNDTAEPADQAHANGQESGSKRPEAATPRSSLDRNGS